MPYLLTSVRPISSIFVIDSLYPNNKQSYCESKSSGHLYGGMHSPATLEQIIKVNKNFIDNPILSPILQLLIMKGNKHDRHE
jgi:hypothetical protein